MIDILNRRDFLRASGLGLGASALAGLFPTGALADYGPIYYDKSAVPENFGRREIIAKAMNLLHNRFRDVHVVQNVYNLAPRGGYNLTSEAMKNAALPEKEPYYSFLLWYQLTNLRRMERDGKPYFPKVTFEAEWSEEDASAWGLPNLVAVKHQGQDRWTVSGEFTVRVNTRLLGGPGHGSDPLFWAMVIAHEMLHNLGHHHVNGNDNRDYSDRWQINMFHRAVYCNGAYKIGVNVPGFV